MTELKEMVDGQCEVYDRVCIGKHETGYRRTWRDVTTDGVKVVDAERSPLDT